MIGGADKRVRVSDPVFIEVFRDRRADVFFESIADIGLGVVERTDQLVRRSRKIQGAVEFADQSEQPVGVSVGFFQQSLIDKRRDEVMNDEIGDGIVFRPGRIGISDKEVFEQKQFVVGEQNVFLNFVLKEFAVQVLIITLAKVFEIRGHDQDIPIHKIGTHAFPYVVVHLSREKDVGVPAMQSHDFARNGMVAASGKHIKNFNEFMGVRFVVPQRFDGGMDVLVIGDVLFDRFDFHGFYPFA